MGKAFLLALLLAGCADRPRIYGVHADTGAQVTAEEYAQMGVRRKSECQRLYGLLGDPRLTTDQIDAVRASMAAKSCAGLVP